MNKLEIKITNVPTKFAITIICVERELGGYHGSLFKKNKFRNLSSNGKRLMC